MANQVWFITGASKGLGLALAKKLLKQGYKVAATSRSVASLQKVLGPQSDQFLPLQMDLSDEANVQTAIQKTVKNFGSLDVVVNNAGYGQFGAVEELSDAEVRENFNVNFFGTLNVIRGVLPYMRETKSGHIFNISSVGGFVGNFPGVGVYCSTKFAVAGLTEGLSAELAPLGIKATIVYPGYFKTNFLSEGSIALPKMQIAEYEQARQVIEMHAKEINQNQTGDPDKAADAMILAAQSKEPILHLFLGSDAYKMAHDKIKSVQQQLEALKELTLSTDIK